MQTVVVVLPVSLMCIDILVYVSIIRKCDEFGLLPGMRKNIDHMAFMQYVSYVCI